jgi:hypothetical protein
MRCFTLRNKLTQGALTSALLRSTLYICRYFTHVSENQDEEQTVFIIPDLRTMTTSISFKIVTHC